MAKPGSLCVNRSIIEPVEGRCLLSHASGTGLTGEYFQGSNFQTPLLVRTDPQISFNWSTSTPDSAIPAGSFSTRWTGEIVPRTSETYTFYTRTDDGVRLWVNGQLIIDHWKDQAGEERSGSITLQAGQFYNIRLEYYQNKGAASARLLWSTPTIKKQIIPTSALYPDTSIKLTPTSGVGLIGNYYSDQSLTTPLMTRVDPTVNFNWPKSGSSPLVADKTFSIRWTGQVTVPQTGLYWFYTKADDGARLWVNGTELVNDWHNHPAKLNGGSIRLTAGQSYDITMEYYEDGVGLASAQLLWSFGKNGAITVVPTQYLSHNGAATATNLTVTSVSAGSINLGWTGSASATGYVVERSTNPRRGFSQIASTTADVTTYSDTTISSGVQYFYRVVPTGQTGSDSTNGTTPSNTATALLPPNSPTSIQATAVSATSIAVTWAAVATATSYTLQRSTDNTTFADAATTQGSIATFTDTGLNAGTVYYYRVIAHNASGDSNPSAVASAVTDTPNAPATLTANAISTSEIDLAWSASSGASGYSVMRSADGSTGWTDIADVGSSTTTLADTGLNAGERCYYQVIANSPAGGSSASPTADDTTAPAAPTNAAATATGTTTASLIWNDVTGATGFTVLGSDDGGTTYTELGTTTSGITTFHATGLTPATLYQFEVEATNNAGISAPSNPASATTLCIAPVNVAAQAQSASQINVTWNATTGATSYIVERSADGSTGWTAVGTPATPSLDDTGLSAGTTYYYRVTAVNAGGNSAPSAVASDTTVPASPTNMVAEPTNTQVDLTWDPMPGAISYLVEHSTDGVNFSAVGTVATNAFSDSGLTRGTTYTYRVSASNHAGTSAPSATVNATTAPVAPASLSVTKMGVSEIDLTWSPTSSATGYTLQRSTDGTHFTDVQSFDASTLSFADAGLNAATPYDYQIIATNAAGNSPPTATSATTLTQAPTNLVAQAVSASRINLTWNDVTGETGFNIDRSPDGSSGWSQIGTVNTGVTSFADNGLTAGTTYFYRIEALDAGGPSASSNVSSDTTVPSTPMNVTGTTASASASLTWTPSQGATGYTIQRSTDGVNFSNAGTSASPSFTDTGLSTATTYKYQVIATNHAGASAPSSPQVTLQTVPDAPTGVSATAISPTTVDISWTADSGATSYTVDRSTDGVTYTPVGTSSNPSFQDTNAAPGTLYDYEVTATDSGGTSSPSVPASATTPTVAATNASATPISASTISIAWTAAAGANSYSVERSNDGSTGWTQVGTTGAGVTTISDTGRTADTTYYYHVIAVDSVGPAAASNVTNATTLPAAPGGVSATATSDTQINVTWNDVPGENGFVIERSLNGSTSWAQVGTVGAGTTTFYNAGLAASTTYYYRVSATNASGSSVPSSIVNATTAATIPSYAADNVVFGLSTTNDVYSINTNTGAATKVGTMSFATVAGGRDPISGKFYYIENNTSTPRVAIWDPATNTNTTINTLSLTGSVLRAGFRRDGTLFITAGNGDLYTIDRTTGNATLLGTVTVGGTAFSSSSGDLAFGPDGTLYMGVNGNLYSVDIPSLNATLIGAGTAGNTQIAFGDDGVLYASGNNNSLYSVSLTTGATTLIGSSGASFGDLASVPRYTDLGITQTASTFTKGTNAAYTLQVTSAGPDSLSGPLTVTDVLPAGLSFVSAAGNGWSANVNGQTVVLSYGAPVAANATLPPVLLTVAVSPTAPANVVNTVTVSSTVFDPVNSNNISVLATPVN